MKTYNFDLNTRPFGRVGSVLEFYQLIGFDFRGKDVRNLRINPKSGEQLQYIMIRTSRNYMYKAWEDWRGIRVSLIRGNFFNPKYAERFARYDFLNYSPQDDAALPKSVMVEYEPGDEEYQEPRGVAKR